MEKRGRGRPPVVDLSDNQKLAIAAAIERYNRVHGSLRGKFRWSKLRKPQYLKRLLGEPSARWATVGAYHAIWERLGGGQFLTERRIEQIHKELNRNRRVAGLDSSALLELEANYLGGIAELIRNLRQPS